MTVHNSSGESSEVTWLLGETSMYGTLVRPVGSGPFPAVVMVAGSGPTDRDWNSPLLPGPNGSARLLAAALARAGFASLRYDKRAPGPHARENMQALIGKLSAIPAEAPGVIHGDARGMQAGPPLARRGGERPATLPVPRHRARMLP